MPYKNKEQEREYKKQWSKRKYRHLGNTSKTITFEQLTRDYAKKIVGLKTWSACVRECLPLIQTHRGNQIKVAAIAGKAVTIKHGGDRKSKKWNEIDRRNTLKAFATEIGINYKTLWHWTLYKNVIFDNLNAFEQDKGLNLSAARHAVWNEKNKGSRKNDNEILREYRNLVKQPSSASTSAMHIQNIRRAAEWFAKNDKLNAIQHRALTEYVKNLKAAIR